jgi:glycosyltransferase involved in cell wall biosynthesis
VVTGGVSATSQTDASAPASNPAPKRGRAVLLIANAAAPYSRGLRVARSLAQDGWDVEIAAVAEGDHPAEERDGDIVIRRYAPSGKWADRQAELDRVGHRGSGPIAAVHRGLGRVIPPLRRLPPPTLAELRRVAAWPMRARGWWATLERDLPPADLYHAFGILTIPAALRLGASARRAGRAGRVVYDVIDVTLESNNYSDLPGPLLGIFRRRERGWAHQSDAVITVNEPIAEHLVRAWGLSKPPGVLLNCQPRWMPPSPRPDAIREATGIPPERRIVLWLGRLGRERGLEEAAEAVLRLDDAALVMLGWGHWQERMRERDADPRFVGRHFTLPPVHPDLVPLWTASADASIIAVPANSLNQRLSTPNKFWESITAGTPVVLGRELEVMRRLIEPADLGRVADPADPADLARALAEVLDCPPAERDARRERCLAVARDEWNWESAVQPYLELVRGLASR